MEKCKTKGELFVEALLRGDFKKITVLIMVKKLPMAWKICINTILKNI